MILIILAGVAISLTLGNNGLFNKAKEAKEKYINAQDYEEAEIAKMPNKIDSYVGYSRTGGSNINYSTNEQIVGTWIDGKPLYRSIICYNNSVNSTTTIKHNIKDIDEITYSYAIGKWTNGSNGRICYNPLPMSKVEIYIDNEEITYIPSAYGVDSLKFIIEYTKTTD